MQALNFWVRKPGWYLIAHEDQTEEVTRHYLVRQQERRGIILATGKLSLVQRMRSFQFQLNGDTTGSTYFYIMLTTLHRLQLNRQLNVTDAPTNVPTSKYWIYVRHTKCDLNKTNQINRPLAEQYLFIIH